MQEITRKTEIEQESRRFKRERDEKEPAGDQNILGSEEIKTGINLSYEAVPSNQKKSILRTFSKIVFLAEKS